MIIDIIIYFIRQRNLTINTINIMTNNDNTCSLPKSILTRRQYYISLITILLFAFDMFR